MTLHAKILATLWVMTVVLILARWYASYVWRHEQDKHWQDRDDLAQDTAARVEQIVLWPSRAVPAVAILDAVLYGLMWVWG